MILVVPFFLGDDLNGCGFKLSRWKCYLGICTIDEGCQIHSWYSFVLASLLKTPGHGARKPPHNVFDTLWANCWFVVFKPKARREDSTDGSIVALA